MTYRFYNLRVISGLALPELALSRGAPDLRVCLGRGRQWVGGRWRWFRVWRGPGGEPWLKTGKDESRYLLRFPRQADFLVEPDGVTTTCYPRRGLPRATLRHLLLDHVLPLVVSHRGRIILHASAVATLYGGVGFLAATGAGKSTLAASLSRRGWPLVADDSLQVEPGVDSVVATASYSGLRLWPGSFAALRVAPTGAGRLSGDPRKRRVGPETPGFRFRKRPISVSRLYVLASPQPPGGGVTIVPLSRRDGLIELVRHAYTLDIDDRPSVAAHFERLCRRRLALSISRLSFPRGFAHLPAVRDAIRADLRSPTPETRS